MKSHLAFVIPLTLVGCTGVISGGSSTPLGNDKPGSVIGGGTAGGGSIGAGSTGAGSTGAGTSAECTDSPSLDAPRVWRLTHTQLTNTLRDEFSFRPPSVEALPLEERLDGFANRARALLVSPLLADTYYKMGEELAVQAVANPSSFGISCAIANIGTGTCLRSFITTLGQKMWRRPLTDAEITKFTTLYTTTAAQGDGPAGGVKGVVQAAFLSPDFLHRSELGTVQTAGMVTQLTDYELASALSYTLWDTAPDATLIDLAGQGKLRDSSVLLSEAKRLLGVVDKASSAMHNFLQQWLFIENLPTADKDPTLFPLALDGLATDLKEENRLFMNSVLFDAGGDRSFKTLFTASYSFVNERTAPLYGLMGVTGSAFTRHELDPKERRGIFTLPSFMWAHASSDGTSLVGRGSYLRNDVLCSPVEPPPGGIVQGEAKFADENATGREKFTIHSQPACASCHRLFDGIGFSMESYDAIGHYRTTDHGKTIDPTGTIPVPSDPPGSPGVAFTSFVDLVDKLAQKPDVYSCFSSQYLTYASGRAIGDINKCETARISNAFVKADYKIDSLILSVIGSPNFVSRQN